MVCLAVGVPVKASQIHLDRNVTAYDQMLRCDRAARSDRASQAADLLAELLESSGDQLVAIEPGLYMPVASAARRFVSKWPAAAVKQLVEAWQPIAAERWRSAAESPDIGVVSRFASRFFPASAGAEAAERAARLAIEAGQIKLAQFWLRELLQFHPERGRRGPVWQRLRSACLRLSGRKAKALKAEAGKAASGPPGLDHTGLAGNTTTGTEPPVNHLELESLKSLFAPTAPKAHLGSLDRLAILWQADLAEDRPQLTQMHALRTSWQPVTVVANRLGAVLVQWQQTCWAFDQGTGSLLWRYESLSANQAARAGLSGPSAPRRPAVSGKRVYLVADVPLPRVQPGPLQAAEALICLDGRSGEAIWIRTAGDLSDRTVPAMLDGTPIVVGDRVLLTARTLRSGGYHDIDLLQLDARTGDLVGRLHLFGVARGGYTSPEHIEPVRLAAKGGIIYLVCAAGTVGAVEANSLSPLWIRLIGEEPATPRPEPRASQQRDLPITALWASEPLVLNDSLIVPAKAGLHVLDCLDGAIVRHVPLSGEVIALSANGDRPSRLAAIAGEMLYRLDVEKGSVTQRMDLAEATSMIGGMCPLGGGEILVSLANGIILARPDGSLRSCRIDAVPAAIPSVTGDRIYLASTWQLVCIADGEKELARLKASMAASGEPLPAIRLGELALRTGSYKLALQSLKRAVDRAGGYEKLVGSETANRLFETCLAFAGEFVVRKQAESLQVAERLLQIAGMCASRPNQHLRHRATLAQLRLKQGKPAEAVAAWQSMISDVSLRDRRVPADLAGKVAAPAGAWAEAKITEAIARYGREIYERFDRQAADLLDLASRHGDPAPLERLIEKYPNSRHKFTAYLGIGEMLIDRGQYARALAPLRMAALRAGKGSQVKLKAMLRLAEAYSLLGSAEAAATWMTRLAKAAPAFAFALAGRRWTAASYADHLASQLRKPMQRVYSLHLPVRTAYQRRFHDSIVLVGTRRRGSAVALDDAVLIWSSGSLQAVQIQTGDPLWVEPARFRTRPIWLYGDRDRIVLADRYRVAALELTTGKQLWQWARRIDDPDAPNVDPESLPIINAAKYAADNLFAITADGQATCLELATGNVKWHRRLNPAYAGHLVVSSDLMVYRCIGDGKVAYAVLNAKTGRRMSLWRPQADLPPETVRLLPADTLMLMTTTNIEAYDLHTGSVLWQVAAKHRFRPTAVLQDDNILYAIDGRVALKKIDTLAGSTLWRSDLPEKLGSPIRTLKRKNLLWLVAERGAAIWEDSTGRLLARTSLPMQLPRRSAIRDARLCSGGVLCLAISARTGSRKATPACLVLFSYKKDKLAASQIATIDLPAGTVSGWEQRDEAVLIASGNALIGLIGQQSEPN